MTVPPPSVPRLFQAYLHFGIDLQGLDVALLVRNGLAVDRSSSSSSQVVASIVVFGLGLQGLDVALLPRDASAVDGSSSLIAQAEPSIHEFGIDLQGLEVALLCRKGLAVDRWQFLLPLQLLGGSKHTCIWDRSPRP